MEILAHSNHFARRRQAYVKLRKRQLNKADLIPSRLPRDTWTSTTRDRLVSKRNSAEERIDDMLSRIGVVYRRERPILIDKRRYFIDFLVTSTRGRLCEKVRVAIEVDGGYHFTNEQQRKDRDKDADLLRSSRVWSIIRISSDAAMTITHEQLYQAIEGIPVGTVRFIGEYPS